MNSAPSWFHLRANTYNFGRENKREETRDIAINGRKIIERTFREIRCVVWTVFIYILSGIPSITPTKCTFLFITIYTKFLLHVSIFLTLSSERNVHRSKTPAFTRLLSMAQWLSHKI